MEQDQIRNLGLSALKKFTNKNSAIPITTSQLLIILILQFSNNFKGKLKIISQISLVFLNRNKVHSDRKAKSFSGSVNTRFAVSRYKIFLLQVHIYFYGL